MRNSFFKPLLAAAVAACAISGAAHAGNVVQESSPVYWGSTAAHAGGWCWYRFHPTGNSIAGKALLSETTANAANITSYVRSSLEVRDGNNNVLTHVEMR